uniref:Microfibril associated protein 4, tandem duplicate 3 n=1 Tax=Nothobranchius furzeri TaxID=105023 RepID=A0A8C6PYQ1_NOTFU
MKQGDNNLLVFWEKSCRSSHITESPMDCSDVYRTGWGLDGVYTIYPAGPTSPVQVYCDMSQDDVIQRRKDGTVNFFMKWDHYKTGFGSAAGEYWLGIKTALCLKTTNYYELRVDMEDLRVRRSLPVTPPSPLGLSLKDTNTHSSNCTRLAFGAFWHTACFGANPNGIYTWGPSPRAAGVNTLEYSLKTMIMKIRPITA